jgi:NTE family protein
MQVQFRNLIFEGGGVKGIAYIGALHVLEQRGILKNIIRLGGTSAGAINALMLAVGFSNREQLDLMKSMDFRRFMDDSFGFLSDLYRLFTKFGWYKGNYFTQWIGEEVIKPKLGSAKATFGDLRENGMPSLYVVGTNLSTGYSEVFSAERHSNMPLAEAVRISMSIPVFFSAVRSGERNDVYVDGGVQLNYPVKLFDREKYIDMENESYAARRTDYYPEENKKFLQMYPDRSPYIYNRQTLGLRLDTKEQIGLYRYNEPLNEKQIKKFSQYGFALVKALMNVQENQHLHSDDWHRTIYIDTLEVGTVDFDLSDEKKDELVRQGIKGVNEYFEWFDKPAEAPMNRIGSSET